MKSAFFWGVITVLLASLFFFLFYLLGGTVSGWVLVVCWIYDMLAFIGSICTMIHTLDIYFGHRRMMKLKNAPRRSFPVFEDTPTKRVMKSFDGREDG